MSGASHASRRLITALAGCLTVAGCAPTVSDSDHDAAGTVAAAPAPATETEEASGSPDVDRSEQERVLEVVTARAGEVGVRHRLVDFAVPFSVVPPDPGGMGGPWYVFSGSTVAGVTLDHAAAFGHPGLTAYAPDQVYQPNTEWEDGELTPAPATFDGWVAWLREHPQLQVSEPRPITIDGVTGQQVVVTVDQADQSCTRKGDLCVPLMPFPDDIRATGPVGFFRGEHHLAIIDIDGRTVLVERSASAERFAEAADTLEALLASLRWSPR